MKLCVVSDLHVDIGNQPPIAWPECDVLIIAGDTGNDIGKLIKLLKRISTRTSIPNILVLDGNHEHYSNANQKRTVPETVERIARLMPDRCTFLPWSTSEKIGDYWFIGRNGWYSFDSAGDPINNRVIWKNEMNDDRNIGFSKHLQTPPWELAMMHAENMRQMIVQILDEEPDAKIVATTHTAPHRQMLSMRPEYLSTNPFYVNTHMERLIEDYGSNIVLWAHGHTHHRSDKVIDGVYIVANPRGYPSENPGWEPVVFDL